MLPSLLNNDTCSFDIINDIITDGHTFVFERYEEVVNAGDLIYTDCWSEERRNQGVPPGRSVHDSKNKQGGI